MENSSETLTPKEHYQIIWDHINSEINILNQKMSTLIGSQSFLFLAYVSLLNSPENLRADFLGQQHHLLLWLFPLIAFLIVLFTYLSMISSHKLISGLGERYRKFPKDNVTRQLPSIGGGERLLTLSNGSILILPLLLLVAWLILIIQQIRLSIFGLP